jgi:hypothetical protein
MNKSDNIIYLWLNTFANVVLDLYKQHGETMINQFNKIGIIHLPNAEQHIKNIRNCMSDMATPQDALSTLFWNQLQFEDQIINANIESIYNHLNQNQIFVEENFQLIQSNYLTVIKIISYLRETNQMYNDMRGSGLEECSLIQLIYRDMYNSIKIKSMM